MCIKCLLCIYPYIHTHIYCNTFLFLLMQYILINKYIICLNILEIRKLNILFIKFLNNIFQVFGAYCSTRWCERNLKDDRGHRQAYFGTGETFLFSLYPERAKYPWVGMDSSHNDSRVHHSAELFMAADSRMITIGGG